MRLYSYYRSSAAYRLRIALKLKGLAYDYSAVNLLEGEQGSEAYRAINPAALVPALELGPGEILTQSVAILEWLEETQPEPPLLPADPWLRARIRSIVNHIACDVHPLCNSGVIAHLKNRLGAEETQVTQWFTAWMHRGFTAIESLIDVEDGEFCLGDTPTLADVCLVPQIYNARRFSIPLEAFPRVTAVAARCAEHPAFADAAPERQPDAPR